jgi:hypothetical protein
MEFLILLAIVAPLFALSIYLGSKANLKRKQQFETNLLAAFGSKDLNAILERELEPAVAALAKRDYFAVTAHYVKCSEALSQVAFETKIKGALQWDGNDRYAWDTIQRAQDAFLARNNLFEPEEYIDAFSGTVSGIEVKFGSDWISGNQEIFPLSDITDIEVYSEGQKIVNFTSRASLTSAVVGAFLPGSSLLWAMARPKVTRHEEDTRDSCLLVIGDNFEIEVSVDPDDVREVRSFAKRLQKQVEIAKGIYVPQAKSDASKPKSKKRASAEPSNVSLKQLTEMYTDGLITADEFAALKKNL